MRQWKQKKVKISLSEVRAHIAEQFEFLGTTARLYDEGSEPEAKRLAVVLRTLLHETRVSHALLAQLGSSFRWRFHDSAFPLNPNNYLAHHGLVSIKLGPSPSTRYEPLCASINEPLNLIEFRHWWNTTILKDENGSLFSRRQTVLVVANQDGGAHVDPELDAAYANLTW